MQRGGELKLGGMEGKGRKEREGGGERERDRGREKGREINSRTLKLSENVTLEVKHEHKQTIKETQDKKMTERKRGNNYRRQSRRRCRCVCIF